MVSPQVRREQLDFVRGRGLSLRRACGLIGMSRATPGYALRQRAKDAPVMAAMRDLSAQYPRYGYRRIRVFLRSDNGPEFVSQAILEWITHLGIATVLNDPGKPWQNGTDESFDGKFRDECLSIEWFRSRREAAVLIEAWRIHYNAVRPHSSLGYLTPNEFKQHQHPQPQPAIF